MAGRFLSSLLPSTLLDRRRLAEGSRSKLGCASEQSDAASSRSIEAAAELVCAPSTSLAQVTTRIRRAIFDAPNEVDVTHQPPLANPLVRAWRALLLAQALLARATLVVPSIGQQSKGSSTVSDRLPRPPPAAIVPAPRRAEVQAHAALALLVALGGLCAAGGSIRRSALLEEARTGDGHPFQSIPAVTSTATLAGPSCADAKTLADATDDRRTACIERLLELLVGIFVVGGIRPPPAGLSGPLFVPVGLVVDLPPLESAWTLSVWHLAERVVAELDRCLPSAETTPCSDGSLPTAVTAAEKAAYGRLVRSRISLAYLEALFASAPIPASSGRTMGSGRGSGLPAEASKRFAECIRLGRLVALVGSPATLSSPTVSAPLVSDLTPPWSLMAGVELARSAHANRLVWKARKRLELAGLNDRAVQGLPVTPPATAPTTPKDESSLLAPPRRLRGKRLAERRKGTYVPPASPKASPPLSVASLSSSSSSLASSVAESRRLARRNQSTTSLPSLERRRSTDLLRASSPAKIGWHNHVPPASVAILAAASPLLKSPIPRPLPTLLDPQAIFANGGLAATAVAGSALVAYTPVELEAVQKANQSPPQLALSSWARTIRRQASSTLRLVWQPIPSASLPAGAAAASSENDGQAQSAAAPSVPSLPVDYEASVASPAPSICPSLASDSTAPTTISSSPPANGHDEADDVLPGPTPQAIPWASVPPAIGFTPSSHDTLGADDDEADEKAATDGARYPRMASGGGWRRGGVLRSFSPVPSRLKSAIRATRP